MCSNNCGNRQSAHGEIADHQKFFPGEANSQNSSDSTSLIKVEGIVIDHGLYYSNYSTEPLVWIRLKGKNHSFFQNLGHGQRALYSLKRGDFVSLVVCQDLDSPDQTIHQILEIRYDEDLLLRRTTV